MNQITLILWATILSKVWITSSTISSTSITSPIWNIMCQYDRKTSIKACSHRLHPMISSSNASIISTTRESCSMTTRYSWGSRKLTVFILISVGSTFCSGRTYKHKVNLKPWFKTPSASNHSIYHSTASVFSTTSHQNPTLFKQFSTPIFKKRATENSSLPKNCYLCRFWAQTSKVSQLCSGPYLARAFLVLKSWCKCSKALIIFAWPKWCWSRWQPSLEMTLIPCLISLTSYGTSHLRCKLNNLCPGMMLLMWLNSRHILRLFHKICYLKNWMKME